MADAFRLLRPLQWAKNVLVFLPFLFAVDIAWSVDALGDIPPLLGRLAVLFLGFCVLSSGVYVFNDLMDRQADRAHPRKRHRPIASGRVGVPAAMVLIVVLTVSGLAAAWYVGLWLLLVSGVYLTINAVYSLGGKNVVLLDVFSVASGYVIRAVSGALAIDVDPSPWLYTTTGAGALFIVLGRAVRRGPSGRGQRGPAAPGAGPVFRAVHIATPEHLSNGGPAQLYFIHDRSGKPAR